MTNRTNDPERTYRRKANECRKGLRCYNGTFGFGKAPKQIDAA